MSASGFSSGAAQCSPSESKDRSRLVLSTPVLVSIDVSPSESRERSRLISFVPVPVPIDEARIEIQFVREAKDTANRSLAVSASYNRLSQGEAKGAEGLDLKSPPEASSHEKAETCNCHGPYLFAD